MQGYGVVETGWTRSELMQPTIELAKSSNTLNKLTFVLLYATDFADRLEKEIIPALKAGFIVLSDRYIFTALARAGVRGVDRTWLRNLYGFAIAPHLVFYLKIDVKTLIRRVLQARGMDYWESGMDLKLGDDIYDSFRAYQKRAAAGVRVDGRRVPLPRARRPAQGRRIQDELRRQVGAFLGRERHAAGAGGAGREPRPTVLELRLFTRNLHRRNHAGNRHRSADTDCSALASNADADHRIAVPDRLWRRQLRPL